MLHARCDESYAGSPRITKLYVVAGFVASVGQWWEFDRLWRRAMRDLGIEDIGCHASKCATGAKPYHDLAPQRRHEIQRQLLASITAAGLHGCVAVSDLDGWRSRREKFSQFLGKDQKKFNEPHLLAHRQCVLLMFDVTGKATKEPIAFVFDRNNDTGGRAREWYNLTIKSTALPSELRARMGPYDEGDRMRTLGLQAADMLAYAAFRHFSGKPSWQWQSLVDAQRMSAMMFDESYWQTLEDDLGDASTDGKHETP